MPPPPLIHPCPQVHAKKGSSPEEVTKQFKELFPELSDQDLGLVLGAALSIPPKEYYTDYQYYNQV